MTNKAQLVNPLTKYFNGEYDMQFQEYPGVQSEMTPVPDCGEESYKGCGRLKGRKALITGGDSGIGRAAAIAYAREGADVAINYLPDEEVDAREVKRYIEAAGGKAVLLPGDAGFCSRRGDMRRSLGTRHAVDRAVPCRGNGYCESIGLE